MHPQLNEGLRPDDLQEMVHPIFEVDTFSSKMGEDQDVCVVSFKVKDRSPAKDLMEFIEKGYDFVLDSDISSGEDNNGEYSVFVELSRIPKLAEQIKELTYVVRKLTGLDDFKFKYASQPFSNCRTIPGHTTDKPFKFNVFALAAVATHYSRTCCADDFLKTCDDPEFATIVFGLKEHTPATLVSGFLSEYTVHDATGLIRIKDLHFLWRVFMRSKSLPNVISSINLKHILTEMNVLDNTETCRGLSPTQTPAVLNFKYFWDTYVIKDESNSFEVTELAELYNSWCEGKYLHLSLDACQTWLNSTLVNGKARVRCLLWNKSADIENAKEAFRHLPEYSDNLDEQYTFYCSYTKRFSKMLVTRDYFNLN